jgi:hypothetical protein
MLISKLRSLQFGVGALLGALMVGMGLMLAMAMTFTGWSLSGAVNTMVPQPVGRFETFISNTVDEGAEAPCDGGLTHNLAVSEFLGAKYLPIHNHCGGFPILDLRIGDTVTIRDVGEFEVTDFRSVPFGNIPATALVGLDGDAIIQTSYRDNSAMRAVALTRVDAS